MRPRTYELVREHEDGLEGEMAVAHLEQFVQVLSQSVDNYDGTKQK
jgi:hypothetical protein